MCRSDSGWLPENGVFHGQHAGKRPVGVLVAVPAELARPYRTRGGSAHARISEGKLGGWRQQRHPGSVLKKLRRVHGMAEFYP